MSRGSLETLIGEILDSSTHIVQGVHVSSANWTSLLGALTDWARSLGRSVEEVGAGIEPALRQSILMTLIPEKAIDPKYRGSYDTAIDEHLAALGVTLFPTEKQVIRNLVINFRKLQGLDSQQARKQSKGISDLKGNPALYQQIRSRQADRCMWCGASFLSPDISESLEHVLPKHLGDDPVDGSNWGLACVSCNIGKGDAFVWSTTSYAYDFFGRTDFSDLATININHRWVALRRAGKCDGCGKGPNAAELWVYKRLKTGLAVPSNCSVTCASCAKARGLTILKVRWADPEKSRTTPI